MYLILYVSPPKRLDREDEARRGAGGDRKAPCRARRREPLSIPDENERLSSLKRKGRRFPKDDRKALWSPPAGGETSYD